jgi:hypothetical protein
MYGESITLYSDITFWERNTITINLAETAFNCVTWVKWLLRRLVAKFANHVTTRSKVSHLFDKSNFWFGGSSPARGMGVLVGLFHVCAVLCVGNSPATDRSPIQRDLWTVHMITKPKKRWNPLKDCASIAGLWMNDQNEGRFRAFLDRSKPYKIKNAVSCI